MILGHYDSIINDDMDKKIEKIIKNLFNKDVKHSERIGGFTAENYLVVTENNKKYIVKFLGDKFSDYESKLKQTRRIMGAERQNRFAQPIWMSRKHKLVVLPYVRGKVLHGEDIKPQYYTSVARVFKDWKSKKVKHCGLRHSANIYLNIKKSKQDIDALQKQLKQTDFYYKTVKDILDLKQSIVSKYENDTELDVWLRNSKDFVHGDFHNENILFSKNNVKAVLDFELAHCGHYAEDMINFVWFAFLNNDLSDKNLNKSADFLRICRQETGVSKQDLKNAFVFTFLRFVQSSFLEKSLVDSKEQFFEGLLRRDLKKFKEIDENMSSIINKLIK